MVWHHNQSCIFPPKYDSSLSKQIIPAMKMHVSIHCPCRSLGHVAVAISNSNANHMNLNFRNKNTLISRHMVLEYFTQLTTETQNENLFEEVFTEGHALDMTCTRRAGLILNYLAIFPLQTAITLEASLTLKKAKKALDQAATQALAKQEQVKKKLDKAAANKEATAGKQAAASRQTAPSSPLDEEEAQASSRKQQLSRRSSRGKGNTDAERTLEDGNE